MHTVHVCYRRMGAAKEGMAQKEKVPLCWVFLAKAGEVYFKCSKSVGDFPDAVLCTKNGYPHLTLPCFILTDKSAIPKFR